MKSLLRQKKVFVIAESQLVADLMQRDLAKAGAQVTTFLNGLEGLAAIRTQSPDLVMIDLHAPILNGLEVLKVLKTENRLNALPVLALASRGESTEISEMLDLGARDYISKDTFEPGEIVEKVTRYVTAEAVHETNYDTNLNIDSASVEHEHHDGPMPRAYIIEDDPLLRNLLSVKLTKSNIKTVFNTDGAHALDLMKDFKPTVLILDLMLPGRNGFDILRELRADDQMVDLPVIVLSNRSNPEDMDQAKELGAAHFFVKALTDLNDVVTAINDLTVAATRR